MRNIIICYELSKCRRMSERNICMATNTESYSVLYRISLVIIVGTTLYELKSSDIVSISIMNNYDTRTFPIVRIRLETELDMMEMIGEYPNDIKIEMALDGGMYKLSSDGSIPICVDVASTINLNMKGYVENKNTPTSSMDQFVDGIKKQSDLNVNIKVPIEIYGYNPSMVYYMKRQCQSIYKDMTITSVIDDMLDRGSVLPYQMDPLHQQEKFNQILIPNMNILQGLSYLESYYGMHETGSQVYGDIDGTLYIASTDTRNVVQLTDIIPIYVTGYQNNTDESGYVMASTSTYYRTIKSNNISVLSETDLEKYQQSRVIGDINMVTSNINSTSLDLVYDDNDGELGNLGTPNIMHKHINPFVSTMYAARIQEKTTHIDVSGTGFDIGDMKIYSRYNLIFESPIRGIDMSAFYRATYINHVLGNVGNNLFCASTTMSLCRN